MKYKLGNRYSWPKHETRPHIALMWELFDDGLVEVCAFKGTRQAPIVCVEFFTTEYHSELEELIEYLKDILAGPKTPIAEVRQSIKEIVKTGELFFFSKRKHSSDKFGDYITHSKKIKDWHVNQKAAMSEHVEKLRGIK